MIKKTITYEDFNGVEQTEDFWFHLSKLEVAELELLAETSMEAKIKQIIESKDTREIYKMFKQIIVDAYGKKTPDGKRFIKDSDTKLELTTSPALDELIMEFIQNPDSAATFIRGIIPKSMQSDFDEEAQKQNIQLPEPAPTAPPVVEEVTPTETLTEGKTDAELLKMDAKDMSLAQLQRAWALKSQGK